MRVAGCLFLSNKKNTPVLTYGVSTFSSGLWAFLSLAISFQAFTHSFPCVLQTGRPGSIISRARAWQPSLKAKHKLCRGLMMPLGEGSCSSTHLWAPVQPANEPWPSLQPSLCRPLPSHCCPHPQRVPPAGCQRSAVSGHRPQASRTASPWALPLPAANPPGSKAPVPQVHPQKVRECQRGPEESLTRSKHKLTSVEQPGRRQAGAIAPSPATVSAHLPTRYHRSHLCPVTQCPVGVAAFLTSASPHHRPGGEGAGLPVCRECLGLRALASLARSISGLSGLSLCL